MFNSRMGCVLLGLSLAGMQAAMGQAHDAHETAPATQPATAPNKTLNPDLAMAMLQAGGGIYTSIRESIEKGDLDTAAALCEDLGKIANEFKTMAAGSPLEVLAIAGVSQFNRFRDAVAAKDLEKSKTLMAGLDRIGESIGNAIESLRAPTTQPH